MCFVDIVIVICVQVSRVKRLLICCYKQGWYIAGIIKPNFSQCSLFSFVFAFCSLCYFDGPNDGLAYLFIKSTNPGYKSFDNDFPLITWSSELICFKITIAGFEFIITT